MVLAIAIFASFHAEARARIDGGGKDSAVAQIVNHGTSQLVTDFYTSLDVRNALKTRLLARADNRDVVRLKSALASFDRDKKNIRVTIEDGQLRVADLQGRIIAEITAGGTAAPPSKDGKSSADFVLNARPFRRPEGQSLFNAIERHLLSSTKPTEKNALWQLPLIFSTVEASPSRAEVSQAALPVYLYIDFHDANQTPPQSHSVLQEVNNQGSTISSLLMPDSSYSFLTLAKRFVLDEKGTLACEGAGASAKAKGVARIDGQLHRFESRPDGDIVITPAFRDGPPVRLRPSRIDFEASSKHLDFMLEEFNRTKSPEAAQSILDGPVRTICERITMLKVDPKVASLCERAYEKKVSIEGRCLDSERGPARLDCEQSRGLSLSQNSYTQAQDRIVKFVTLEAESLREMARSVANVKIIGRKLSIGQCQDGMRCDSVGSTNAIEMVRPAPPNASSKAAEVLARRHRTTGDQPLVKYSCSLQNESCAHLIETDSVGQLPAADREKLRAEIRKANLSIHWRKDVFLAEASALRPLGQCCAEAPCRERLTKELGLKLNFNGTDSMSKGTAK